MTARPQTPDRDEVLFAFHEACSRPTAQQIIDWTSRYPQFADDIRAHAAVARDWDTRRELAAEEPSETELARAYSRAINALYEADTKAATSATAPQTFQDILAARGTNARALAQERRHQPRRHRRLDRRPHAPTRRAPLPRRGLPRPCHYACHVLRGDRDGAWEPSTRTRESGQRPDHQRQELRAGNPG